MAHHEWLEGTYWYVPQEYLPAARATNQDGATRVTRAKDQTVWYIQGCTHGYVAGTSATSVDGSDWNYMLLVGSIVDGGRVKFSFSPLGEGGDAPPTIGDGELVVRGGEPAFLMQMTSGTTASTLTHWAYMLQVTPDDPEWLALPGYPDTGVPDLTALQTPVVGGAHS